MPLPFTRELYLTAPPLTGNDVLIACHLLIRDSNVMSTRPNFQCDETYDVDDDSAFTSFNDFYEIKTSSSSFLDSSYNKVSDVLVSFNNNTANLLLSLHSSDSITDFQTPTPQTLGYLYKLYVPMHQNRSIETFATLYNSNNTPLYTFKVRTHGMRSDGTSAAWPDFGATPGDFGLNMFSSNGNTPSGIVELDLNTPEPNSDEYGPYPVNRVVRGLEGNAAFLLPNIRDGVLLHTGNWSTPENGIWSNTKDMPNSSGCIHAHPDSVKRVYELLVNLGVQIRENTFSGKNYPYKPQGIGVFEVID